MLVIGADVARDPWRNIVFGAHASPESFPRLAAHEVGLFNRVTICPRNGRLLAQNVTKRAFKVGRTVRSAWFEISEFSTGANRDAKTRIEGMVESAKCEMCRRIVVKSRCWQQFNSTKDQRRGDYGAVMDVRDDLKPIFGNDGCCRPKQKTELIAENILESVWKDANGHVIVVQCRKCVARDCGKTRTPKIGDAKFVRREEVISGAAVYSLCDRKIRLGLISQIRGNAQG